MVFLYDYSVLLELLGHCIWDVTLSQMDNDIVIATFPDGEIRLTALGIEVSHDNPKNLADGEISGYTGPLEIGFVRENQKHVGTLSIRNLTMLERMNRTPHWKMPRSPA
jgi:hypothetical protein